MPCDYGRWFHDRQNIRPSRPHAPQHDPKEPIEATQHRSSTFPLQHSHLLAPREHLQRDVQATAKENRKSGENRAEHIDHKSAVTWRNDSVSRIWVTGQTIDLTHQYRFDYAQPVLLLFVLRLVRLLLSGHQAVAIENAALRMQIAAFQRKRKRPLLTTLDRVFWITLRSLWSDWRHPLIYVQADTVVRWHRERFRRFWARLSRPQRRRRGRPGTAAELRQLIEQMATANPL
jgi:hypothetical protein